MNNIPNEIWLIILTFLSHSKSLYYLIYNFNKLRLVSKYFHFFITNYIKKFINTLKDPKRLYSYKENNTIFYARVFELTKTYDVIYLILPIIEKNNKYIINEKSNYKKSLYTVYNHKINLNYFILNNSTINLEINNYIFPKRFTNTKFTIMQ